MENIGYEIAPAYTVRIGDKLCEADGYAFEVVGIQQSDDGSKLKFGFAPSDLMGRPGPTGSGLIKVRANVRIFRGDK